MKNNDLIQVTFTAEELTENNAHLDALLAFAGKSAPQLSSEDRTNYGSINETNKLLVNKAKSFMDQHPDLVPQFVNIDEFERDYSARETIEEMIQKLDLIKRKLSDTKILLDHDNYQDTMAFYRSIRYYAAEQQQGAIPIYEELKQFFPHGKKKEAEVVK
ncbi:hypothetical protein GQR60_18580 [Labilibaculum sp. A4]|uniref:hypothetical protein n=1 Tax=Labilibaculum TaxID=2060722 RepID=UPI000F627729|nr:MULTISPECIES: hypothetical protein [Labilibaculum]MBN2596396.1 hypothetical protein [Marinifilaceae bacterium]MDQ1772573.1 hypothetical protein [Labilibaculum euxinus]MWN78344.1 hypothetical protein [Labilibaculum euxinus]